MKLAYSVNLKKHIPCSSKQACTTLQNMTEFSYNWVIN